MNLSDSDSDDFFGDIRTLRRKFGLSKSPAVGQTRLAEKPAQTPSRPAKHSLDDPDPVPSLGVVSAGEIAALLSPRGTRQPRKKKTGSASGMERRQEGSPGIPVRTPESRIADPHLLTQKTPVTPTAAPRASGSRRANRRQSRETPEGKFSLQGLWDKADASPLATPIRRNLRTSLLSPRVQIRDAATHSTFSISNNLSDPIGREGLLGKVEEELLTKEDIEAAQRKLSQEQTLTQQQVIRDIRERIIGFASTGNTTSVEQLDCSVTLLCQFYTFGHGELSYDEQGIRWHGDFIGPIANVAQSLDAAAPGTDSRLVADTTLVFPWLRVSSVRLKSIDDKDYVMTTIDSDLGIAFQVGGRESAARIVETVNQQHSRVLAEHQSQKPKRAAACEDGQDTQQLVSMLLSYAKALDPGLEGLDIQQATARAEFMQQALPSVAALAKQLAGDAHATLAYRSDAQSGPAEA
ncbi:hypothetical protein EV183_005320 [Coemansia sp. RSA 2336]|nr:hypothetical protein EV183_005320 [Coemansia sp. RSA 2336]